jgi:hypothetical protein
VTFIDDAGRALLGELHHSGATLAAVEEITGIRRQQCIRTEKGRRQ